jgi:hypothetical protein
MDSEQHQGAHCDTDTNGRHKIFETKYGETFLEKPAEPLYQAMIKEVYS